MQQRTAATRWHRLIIAATVPMFLGACFGGSQPEPATTEAVTAAPEPTATSEATAPPSDAAASAAPEETDSATADIARAGTLRRRDYPDGWTVFSRGSQIDLEENEESCSYQADGPEADLLAGAIQQGPHMQLGNAPGYAHSQVYAFPDEEAAIAWVEYVDSRPWARCVRRQLQAFQDDQESGARVVLHTRQTPTLGEGGFSSYASFAVRNDSGNIEAFTEYQFYRLGRVVIRLGLDIGALDEEQYADYTAGIDEALRAAYARVYALEPAP